MTISATLSIFNGSYTVSVTGRDYEASDHTVGLQGGFTNFDLDSAFYTLTKDDLNEEQLKTLSARIEDNPFELERIFEALDAANEQDINWQD